LFILGYKRRDICLPEKVYNYLEMMYNTYCSLKID